MLYYYRGLLFFLLPLSACAVMLHPRTVDPHHFVNVRRRRCEWRRCHERLTPRAPVSPVLSQVLNSLNSENDRAVTSPARAPPPSSRPHSR